MNETAKTATAALQWIERHCPDQETVDYYREIPVTQMGYLQVGDLLATAQLLGFKG